MTLTKRAKKRILLLIAASLVFGALLVGARLVQNRMKAERARVALELGMEAAKEGDWETALSELSIAVARNKRDVASTLMLAEARLQVPTPGNTHVQRALSLFLLAERIAEETDASADLKIKALEGRGRIEFDLRQTARLKESSSRLFELDPGNALAVAQLLTVNSALGNLLPSDPELHVRGDQSTTAWLQEMQDAKDDSSLRWSLEQFVAGPSSSDIIFRIILLLQNGDSENRQKARLGEVRESRSELLGLLAKEHPTLAADLEVLVAREWLVENQIQRAEEALSKIEVEKIVSPSILLLASAMHTAIGTPESRAEANRILGLAASSVGDDLQSRIRVAGQLWHLEQTARSLEVIEEGLSEGSMASPMDANLLILGSQLNLLDSGSLSDDLRDALESFRKQMKISFAVRNRIQLILDVGELRDLAGLNASKDLRSAEVSAENIEKIVELCGSFAAWTNDPLMLCILADLAADAGLDAIASRGLEDALVARGGLSGPISRRLVKSYARRGALLKAFRTAANYLRQYQTRYAAVVLAEAWLNLQETGVRAIDYEPWLAEVGTPADLLLALRSNSEDDIGLVAPVLARALDAEGDSNAAREVLLGAMAATDDLKTKIRLLATMSRLSYEIPAPMLDAIAMEATSDADRLMVTRVKLGQIERLSGPAAALAWLESEIPLEAQSELLRLKGMIQFRSLRASGESVSPAFDTLLASEVSDEDLPIFMRLAVKAEDRPSAERIFQLAVGQRTERMITPRGALVAALFVTNFDIDDPESVATAIRVLDPVVSAGNANPELEFLYAQILRQSGTEKVAIAIEILRASVAKHPEGYASALLLCEMLQESIQFEEAGEILRDLTRRIDVATEEQRMKMSLLLSRQGELPSMAKSICDLAEETGDVTRLLQCIEAKRMLGEGDEVDRLLDELSIREDRTPAVEMALARRIQSQGDFDGSLQYLAQSEKFSSESERLIAISELAYAAGRWEDVITRLQEPDGAVKDSAKAQLLLATALLEVDPPNEDRALEALRRAVELEPEDRGVLRRAALIAVSTEGLVEARSYFLNRLESVDAAQADLIRLGVDLAESTLQDDVDWESLEARSVQVTDRLPRVPMGWNLRLDVLLKASQAARQRGDPDALERLRDRLTDTAIDYVERFPSQSAALSRQAKILLQLGEPEKAVLVARASVEANVETPRVGIFIDLAQAEFQLERYERVIDALGSFSSQIASDPGRFPLAWNLLFRSLLLTGKIEQAVRLYTVGPVTVNGQTSWLPWISAIEKANPGVALEAASVVVTSTGNVRDLLSLNVSLKRLYRSSGDASVLAYTRELDDRIDALVDAMAESADLRLLQLQMEISSVELTALSDVGKAAVQGMVVFDRIPREWLRSRVEIESLPAGEREAAEAVFAATAVFLNNLVARAAEVIRNGLVADAEVSQLAAVGQAASGYLLSVLPQNSDILDSVADFKTAIGETGRAIEVIKNAIEIDPSSPLYYFTYAKALLAQGEAEAALDQARKASRLEKASGRGASELVSRVNRLLDEIEADLRAAP